MPVVLGTALLFGCGDTKGKPDVRVEGTTDGAWDGSRLDFGSARDASDAGTGQAMDTSHNLDGGREARDASPDLDLGVYDAGEMQVRDASTSDVDADVDFTPLVHVEPVAVVVSEGGMPAEFEVWLSDPPGEKVTIDFPAAVGSEVTISPTTLTFDDSNFDGHRSVTVNATDDDVADGAVTVSITGAVTATRDYANASVPTVGATVTDDAAVGLELVPSMGLVTTEFGGSDSFTVALKSEPHADVIVNAASTDTDEGTVAPSSYSFTSANWDTPRSFTVTGVDDSECFDTMTYAVQLTAASADAASDGIGRSVSAVNLDDDSCGFAVSPANGLVTSEDGGQATFSVVLNAAPTDDVVIPISSSDPDEGTANEDTLIFTSTTWSTPQVVTVTGQDDAPANPADGSVSYFIELGPVVSNDPGYDGLAPFNVSVINEDNDS